MPIYNFAWPTLFYEIETQKGRRQTKPSGIGVRCHCSLGACYTLKDDGNDWQLCVSDDDNGDPFTFEIAISACDVDVACAGCSKVFEWEFSRSNEQKMEKIYEIIQIIFLAD